MSERATFLSTEQAGARVGMSGEWARRQIVAGRLRATAFDTGRRRTYRIRADGRPGLGVSRVKMTTKPRLLETDAYPFEFISEVAERESWRKEIHRPIYHLHKWWAKRLGSIFRGILLGAALDEGADLRDACYASHDFADVTVFDPFMGSGTTVGEAHKLGFTAFGRDINPVAVESVVTAMGPMDRARIEAAYKALDAGVGAKIRDLYRTTDSTGADAQVLYHFWVMQTACPHCDHTFDPSRGNAKS